MINFIKNNAGLVALVILAIMGLVAFAPKSKTLGTALDCNAVTCFTTMGVLTSFQNDGTSIFNGAVTFAAAVTQSAAAAFTSTVTIGTNGSALTEVKAGTCTIFAYATTIAASSTALVDCQAGTSSLSPISGVQAGDKVFASLASTTVAGFEGLQMQWVTASTTAGYIRMKLYNGTGDTFTWDSTASTSIPYLVVR